MTTRTTFAPTYAYRWQPRSYPLKRVSRVSHFSTAPASTLVYVDLGKRCFYCSEEKPLQKEHKTPRARGGKEDSDNIVGACSDCNLQKGTLTAEEFLARRKQSIFREDR